jgi:hypothetical protein
MALQGVVGEILAQPIKSMVLFTVVAAIKPLKVSSSSHILQ